jgi:hypothetical protein
MGLLYLALLIDSIYAEVYSLHLYDL